MSEVKLSSRCQKIYNKTLKPHLHNLEKYRLIQLKEHNRRKSIAKSYGIIIILIASLLEFTLNNGDLFMLIVIASIGYILYIFNPYSKYNKEAKKIASSKFLPFLFKELFNFQYYNKDKQIDENLFKSSSLINIFDRYNSEDYFTGSVGDIKLECADIKLEQNSNKNTALSFKGVVIVLTMPFDFLSHTIVVSKRHRMPDNGLKKVNLESITFEKKYDTYSNDQQASRYLITPAVMQRTLDFSDIIIDSFSLDYNIDDKFSGDGVINYEFKKNKLIILQPTCTDSFGSFSINKSAYDISEIAKIEQQIEFISKITEQLKLDYLTARKLAYKKI